MNSFILLCCFLICLSCNNNRTSKETIAVVPKVKEEPFNCFNGPDTVMITGYTKGCHNRFYRFITDSLVMKLEYKGAIQYDSCVTIKADTVHYKGLFQLLLYEKRKADFHYFCNDYGAGPSREIDAVEGVIYFRFYPPDRSVDSSPHDFRVSIWVEDLEFWDSIRQERITIDNILFFKIPNWTWYAG